MKVIFYTPTESSVVKDIDFVPQQNACITLNGTMYTVEDLVYDVDSNIIRIYVR